MEGHVKWLIKVTGYLFLFLAAVVVLLSTNWGQDENSCDAFDSAAPGMAGIAAEVTYSVSPRICFEGETIEELANWFDSNELPQRWYSNQIFHERLDASELGVTIPGLYPSEEGLSLVGLFLQGSSGAWYGEPSNRVIVNIILEDENLTVEIRWGGEIDQRGVFSDNLLSTQSTAEEEQVRLEEMIGSEFEGYVVQLPDGTYRSEWNGTSMIINLYDEGWIIPIQFMVETEFLSGPPATALIVLRDIEEWGLAPTISVMMARSRHQVEEWVLESGPVLVEMQIPTESGGLIRIYYMMEVTIEE